MPLTRGEPREADLGAPTAATSGTAGRASTGGPAAAPVVAASSPSRDDEAASATGGVAVASDDVVGGSEAAAEPAGLLGLRGEKEERVPLGLGVLLL